MIKMIAAVSKNGCIGKNNTIPWSYPEDMKFFRKTTSNKENPPIVIMGRLTFESMGSKKLPNRRNIVITSKDIGNEVETYAALWEALELGRAGSTSDIWLMGGASIYKEGMNYAQEIYLTEIPDVVEGENLVYFPEIDPTQFKVQEYLPLFNAEGKETLKVAKYVRQ